MDVNLAIISIPIACSWIFFNFVNMSNFRIGNGYDVHALKEGLPMWLCGIST